MSGDFFEFRSTKVKMSLSSSGSSSGFYGRRSTRSGSRVPLTSINAHTAVRYPRADGASRRETETAYYPGALLQDRDGVSLNESDEDGYDDVNRSPFLPWGRRVIDLRLHLGYNTILMNLLRLKDVILIL